MNKTVLVIGASSGIGAAICNKLLGEGNRVVGFSRNAPENQLIEYHQVDVLNQPDSWPSLDMPLDGLVYCPGSINLKPFNRLSREDFLKDFEINALAAASSIKQYLPQLKQIKGSSIVLFSTVAVQRGMPFHASVAMAKGAVEGLTRALAAEFAPTIRVNCIAPSLTDTPMAKALVNTEAKATSSNERHPLKRIGTPNDIAEAACWLLSDNSSWTTGQILHVDGGLSVI
jgi:NAD(P)-dependent dehydrogenase (short-subunit alcohol dehydrogenase family)